MAILESWILRRQILTLMTPAKAFWMTCPVPYELEPISFVNAKELPPRHEHLYYVVRRNNEINPVGQIVNLPKGVWSARIYNKISFDHFKTKYQAAMHLVKYGPK